MTSRRVFLSAIGATAATTISGRAFANDPCAGYKLVVGGEAPRDVSAVRGRPGVAVQIAEIDQGALSLQDVPAAISRNLPLILEQNFEQQTAAGGIQLVNALTERELALLASRYQQNSLNAGRNPRLLDILAVRLQSAQLGRLVKHFGFEDVYAAVNRSAPGKSTAVLASMSGMSPGSVAAPRPVTSADPLLDYTLNEIYLSYRTAPIGALSVSSSLFETAVYAGGKLSLAFSAGYAVGTVMQQTFEYLFPEQWGAFSDSFGSTVDEYANNVKSVVNGTAWENLTRSMKLGIGTMQRLMYYKWMYPGAKVGYEQGGGDLAVAKFWMDKWADESCK